MNQAHETCNRRKWSLYLPVQKSQGKFKEHKKITHPESDNESSARSADDNTTSTSSRDRDRSGQTRLARACRSGNIEEARKWLKERPMEVNVPDYAGNTPLQAAALEGSTEIVHLLLNAGCDISRKSTNKDTPLIDAVESALEVSNMLPRTESNAKQTDTHKETLIGRYGTTLDYVDVLREVSEGGRSRPPSRLRHLQTFCDDVTSAAN